LEATNIKAILPDICQRPSLALKSIKCQCGKRTFNTFDV
jgi:hypothetical protein